jgi:hypothetical protein
LAQLVARFLHTEEVIGSSPVSPTYDVMHAEGPAPAVGDELTALNAWDICFAHTTTQVDSDLTEWGRFSPDAVDQNGPGSFTVTISGVRNGSEAAGTVTCVVEGTVGGVVLASWSRDAG